MKKLLSTKRKLNEEMFVFLHKRPLDSIIEHRQSFLSCLARGFVAKGKTLISSTSSCKTLINHNNNHELFRSCFKTVEVSSESQPQQHCS